MMVETKFLAVISMLGDNRYPDMEKKVRILDLSNQDEKESISMQGWSEADDVVKEILIHFKECDADGDPTPWRSIKTIEILEVTDYKAYNTYIAMKEEFEKDPDKYYEKKVLEAERIKYEEMKSQLDEYERLKEKFEGNEKVN